MIKVIQKLWSPNKYEIDLSNEILNNDLDQGAAKISRSKLDVKRNICRLAQFDTMHPGLAESADLFFAHQL